MAKDYKHTQFGTFIVVALLVAVGVSVGVFASLDLGWLPIVATSAIFGIVLVLFYSLTATVSQGKLKFWFGVGLISKTYELNQIQSVACAQTSWIYGFGVRWIPGGWLYNVSGTKSVEVVFKNGKKIRIGTDQPEALKQAILEATEGLESAQDYAESSQSEKGMVFGILFLVFLILGLVGGLMVYSEREPVISVTKANLVINSSYGFTLMHKKIKRVELKDSMPKVLRKTNGYNSFTAVKKGRFLLKDLGEGMLFISTNKGPYLHVFWGKTFVIINLKDAAKTRTLYKSLLAKTKK